jgi:hypothetical protein
MSGVTPEPTSQNHPKGFIFPTMKRRNFLCAATMMSARHALAAADTGRGPRILLRPGSYQRGNIGDIAHSLGALRLFELHFPAAEMTLWPRGLSAAARANLEKSFPRLRIVEGELDAKGKPSTPELAAAWAESDLLLHGSAPGFKGATYMPAWRAASSKPYGTFGITEDPVSGFGTGHLAEGGTLAQLHAAIDSLPSGHLSKTTLGLLNGAAFVFCRDTLTQRYFRQQAVKNTVLEFGPDATFALHLRDDDRAGTWLRERSLEDDRFICVIPRLRYTPYAALEGRKPSRIDLAKEAINARTVEADHAMLRDLISKWVRETGLKVLLCPEMTYQIELAKKLVLDRLPDEVKSHVIWRDTDWLPDEAASIYARAATVISFECHSPIIALTVGTPAFYVRQPTDTIKGQMYHDIGASDWIFEVEETRAEDLWSRLKEIHENPVKARARVASLMIGVTASQRHMVDAVRQALALGR